MIVISSSNFFIFFYFLLNKLIFFLLQRNVTSRGNFHSIFLIDMCHILRWKYCKMYVCTLHVITAFSPMGGSKYMRRKDFHGSSRCFPLLFFFIKMKISCTCSSLTKVIFFFLHHHFFLVFFFSFLLYSHSTRFHSIMFRVNSFLAFP